MREFFVLAKRLFDIFTALLILALAAIPMLILFLLIRLTSKGPAIHWSTRIGKENRKFKMPKFRSMYIETPEVATHLLKDSSSHITPIGKFMRKTSLDELPQLYSVLTGEMSFVGPRPALFNQDDLVELRTKKNVHRLTPGITGWAQINGRDDISIEQKVELDAYYYNKHSFFFDIKIIILTALQVFKMDGISH